MSIKLFKKLLIPLVYSKPVTKLFSAVYQNTVPIFVFHQFGQDGHDVKEVIAGIRFLQKKGFQFVTINQLLDKLESGESLEKHLVLTFDDGYVDQLAAAKEIYTTCGVPVSLCVITSMALEGIVPWDMRIKYAIKYTKKNQLNLSLEGRAQIFQWQNDFERHDAIHEVRAICEKLPVEKANSIVADVEQQLFDKDMQIHKAYQPLDVEDLKAANFVDLIPHTVSHCVLANESQETKRQEISNSLQVLSEVSNTPIRTFTYPLGKLDNYDFESIQLVEANGFAMALSTFEGYFDKDLWANNHSYKYQVPRIGYPDDLNDFLITASALGRVLENYQGFKLPKLIRSRYGSYSDFMFNALYRLAYPYFKKDVRSKLDISGVERIIFVCSGNICRSPFAHVYAATKGLAVDSIGLFAKSGAKAEYEAEKAALKLGFDMSQHRSKHVSDIKVNSNDLLVAFEPSHIQHIKKQYPELLPQTTLLGLWDKVPNLYVADPYGKSLSYFETCFIRIIKAVDRMAQSKLGS